MINPDNPDNIARQHLADALGNYRPPLVEPLNISPWLAMSLLQKAIRRAREDVALRAAATLHRNSPDRLWRRVGGIAFEDIGLADLETVSQVTAALSGKRLRTQMGGEWPVASFIVSRMSRAMKCRTADDVLMAAELHPTLARARREFHSKTTADLLDIASGSSAFPERALALWYVLGTDRWSARSLPERRGDPRLSFDHLLQTGVPAAVLEIARGGFRKTRSPLPAFVALLWPHRPAIAKFQDDPLPPENIVRDVPGWAHDLYSREGRAALHTFLAGVSETARWVRAHMPGSRRVAFLGGVLFRVEGQVCQNRLRWPLADELRRQADIEIHGPNCPDATEVLDLVRRDIPLLNEVRAHVR